LLVVLELVMGVQVAGAQVGIEIHIIRKPQVVEERVNQH
jgi:hypothetical protein